MRRMVCLAARIQSISHRRSDLPAASPATGFQISGGAVDRAHDTRDFVATMRALEATLRLTQNTTSRRSAIARQATRHEGIPDQPESKRWLAQKPFGWLKRIGGT